jgi:hypothetical protein
MRRNAGRVANFGFLFGFFDKIVLKLLLVKLRVGKGQMRNCRDVQRMAEDGKRSLLPVFEGRISAAGKTGAGVVTSGAGMSETNRRVAFAAECTKALFPYREKVTVPVRDERIQGDDEAGRETGQRTEG